MDKKNLNVAKFSADDFNICVLGLGYVGLPLAVALAKHFKLTGFDLNSKKVEALKKGVDLMNEVPTSELAAVKINYTTDPASMKKCNFIIAAVPTPVTEDKLPDLLPVERASETIGKNISKGTIVMFESTVYPGVTEDICIPIIEKHSGLKCGRDWKIGYSPERINPGDREHTIDKVYKVVSGMDPETLEKAAFVYGQVTKVHRAETIKVAEAAKVIENIQRDLNIALMNELSLIFEKLGIDTQSVLNAAGTKWNFHKYRPGLVGGHCIGVDPYYLTYRAQQLGYEPQVILAGRKINDNMSKQVARRIFEALKSVGKTAKKSRILVLGLTFKENVKDARNSKVKDLIKWLKDAGAEIVANDAFIDQAEIDHEGFGVKNTPLDKAGRVDAIVLATPHHQYLSMSTSEYDKLFNDKDNKIFMDITGQYNKDKAEQAKYKYLRL